MEHSFIPGECRYGKWPAGTHPRELAKKRKEEEARQNVLKHFRAHALASEKIKNAKFAAPSWLAFDSDGPSILKYAFATLLRESIDHFDYREQHHVNHDYIHWLEDSTPFTWVKRIMKDDLSVSGVAAYLQPWTKPLPMPVFTVEQCPFQCLTIGTLEFWRMHSVEDLREMSLHQWHEPIDVDEAWVIAMFGPGLAAAEKWGPLLPLLLRHRPLSLQQKRPACGHRNLRRKKKQKQ